MRYDKVMFVAMLALLIASGVAALAGVDESRRAAASILLAAQPVTERVAALERDYAHIKEAVNDLEDALRRETKEIKQMLREQTDQSQKWIVIVLGLVITGDRGWMIYQRFRNNKREEKP